jgi:hypothetical protein
MALLVVVVLGVPMVARAGQPSVQAPTGPQSNGYFTGVYTFNTYISCTSGFSFSSSYSNSLEGTHTFAFYGSADGSLLVSVDSGGLMLVTSCGDPFTGPNVNVANYTVTKYSTPPPTPTPTPNTPTPTATPGGGGGGPPSGGTTGTTKSTPRPAGSGTGTPTPAEPTPTPTSPSVSPVPGQTSSPSPSSQPAPAFGTPAPGTSGGRLLGWEGIVWSLVWLAIVAALVVAGAIGWRRHNFSRLVHTAGLQVQLRFGLQILRLKAIWRRLIDRGRHEPKRQGLSPHHHTGKLLAHHHTSYPALTFLIIFSAVVAGGLSWSSQAANTNVSVTVLGPPPSTGASIDQPVDGEEFTVSTTTVRGSCPNGLLIEIYRNGVFAGSDTCDTSGMYAILITLEPGSNSLVARTADALGQYGPDSSTITVTYTPPPPPPPAPAPLTPAVTPAPGGQAPRSGSTARTVQPTTRPAPLRLTSDARFYQGVEVGELVTWTVTVSNGQRPFHLSWDAGDGRTSTTELAQNGSTSQSHIYTTAGMYQMTVRVRDAAGAEAAMQLAVIVNGQAAGGVVAQPPSDRGSLIFIWPALVAVSVIVLSFWLGERHRYAMASGAIARPTTPLPGSASG